MDEWVVWVIVAVVFAVGEILTLGFFLGPFAIAAVVAAVVRRRRAARRVRASSSSLASAGAFLGLRPLVRRHTKLPPSCAPAPPRSSARPRRSSSASTATAAA